jgi:hypothetical protein
MAALPDAIPEDTEVAERPSLQTVSPTDFGLGQAGQDFGRAAVAMHRAAALKIRVAQAQDEKAATPIAAEFANKSTANYIAARATWKPGDTDPDGFIAAETKRARAYEATPGLTPGQVSALRLMNNQHLTALTAEASSQAATINAGPIAQMTANSQAQHDTDAQLAKDGAFQPAKLDIYSNHLPTDTDLPTKIAAAYDAAAAPALAAAPPDRQPYIQASFQAEKAKEVSLATAIQPELAQHGLVVTAARQAAVAINGLAANPTAYDTVMLRGQEIASVLPKGQQEAWLQDYGGQAARAKIEALVQHGQYAQAKGELADGRYDKWLKPEDKEGLDAQADAAARGNMPASVDQAMAQNDLLRRVGLEQQALATTGKSTGLVSEAEVRAGLPVDKAADVLTAWTQSRRAYAVGGSVHDMPMSQLTETAMAQPDPSAPDYQGQLMRHVAAGEELQRRASDPGAAVWTSNGKPLTPGATPAAAMTQDRGAALQQMYGNIWTARSPAEMRMNANVYVGAMLGSQASLGQSRASLAVLPTAQIQALAVAVNSAAPDAKPAAMAHVAQLVNALPATFKLPDGSSVNPRTILANQLMSAHISAPELAAIVDHGAQPAALARDVAALADPHARKVLPKFDETNLKTAVDGVMLPFLATTKATPDGAALAQGRQDLAMTVARHIFLTTGASAADSARAAAGDIANGYRYVDTWRIPASEAGGLSWSGDGAGQVRGGASKVVAQLTANNGANLYGPQGTTRQAFAMKVQANGHWMTSSDDSGLTLMVHNPDSSWTQVADRYGRPIAANWAQLKGLMNGAAPLLFGRPPPDTIHAPDGTPAPAAGKGVAFQAVRDAIIHRESGGRDGLTSDQGAMGRMQLLPETAALYAQRATGAPLDRGRLLNDGDYNTAIGSAYLADLSQHYGNTSAGMALTVAAYFAGQGHIDGYTDVRGYHPGLLQTVGDPRNGGVKINDFVARLPPKTQAYVRDVIPRAAANLLARR